VLCLILKNKTIVGVDGTSQEAAGNIAEELRVVRLVEMGRLSYFRATSVV